jgi:hypothetical protein
MISGVTLRGLFGEDRRYLVITASLGRGRCARLPDGGHVSATR